MTSIFLSYARGDDVEPHDPATSFAARLHRDLTAAGFDVWFDRVNMPSRGLTFHQEIRDAIAARDRLLLIVGPKAAASEYVRQEWQFAWFDAEKVVTPILRNGDYPLAIPELALLHAEDFRDDSQYDRHLQELIRILRESVPRLGQLIGVPSLPAHYLSRSDLLTPLRDAVRAGLDNTASLGGTAVHQKLPGIIGRQRMGGMAGMGGIGKSVLASLLAHDRKVREAFPDGIVWVALGSEPKIPDLMRKLHRDLGGDGAFEHAHEGKTKLKEMLAAKSVLLILDDAWRRADVEAFDVLGPTSRALITTRDAQLLTSLGGTPHLIDLLSDDESLRLLAVTIGKELSELPPEATRLIRECGRLPLAVALAGGMIVAGQTWTKLLTAFQRHKLEFFQDDQRDNQHHDLLRTIEVSVQALPPAEQSRLIELGVFPEDETVPEPAIATLWEHTGELDDLDTSSLLLKLKQRSLIQMVSPNATDPNSVSRIGLHDLIHDYCLLRAKQQLGSEQALHEQLLAAYRSKSPDGWPSGPNDGYFFSHLRDHLVQAGHSKEAFQLLQDLNWLDAKTRAGLVFDLVRDVQDAERDLTEADRAVFLPWSQFLRGNASFLSEHPESFFQQAYNQPRQSPVSQSAQRNWMQASGSLERLISASPTFVPLLFLEWRNRPVEWAPCNCLMTLHGHTDSVTRVAISGDGSTIVSMAYKQTVKAWDARTGACHATFQGNPDANCSWAVSRDGATIVLASGDNTLNLWDARTGFCRVAFQGHLGPVFAAAITGDGATVVSGSNDRTIKVWDAHTGVCRITFRGHADSVTHVAVSGDGSTVVSGSEDETVKVWDTRSGTCRATLQKHTDGVQSLAISDDGLLVVSECSTGKVRMWDTLTGDYLATLGGHRGLAFTIAVSKDGAMIVSGSYDTTVKLWDARTGKCNLTLQGHTGPVNEVALSGDGSTVASGSQDETVRVWDTRTGVSLTVIQGHTDGVRCLALSEDGSTVVSACNDLTVKVWDTRERASLETLEQTKEEVTLMTYSRDKATVVSLSDEQIVKVWDVRTEECRATLHGHTGMVWQAVISGDGFTVVTCSEDDTVKVWDTHTGKCRATLRGHAGDIFAVAMSEDGSTIASTGDWNRTVKVWDVHTGTCRATLWGRGDGILGVAISGDGKTVIASSVNIGYEFWDVQTGKRLETAPDSSNEARVAFEANRRIEGRIWDGYLRVPDSDALTPLIVFGPFVQAYGPLMDDKILAFNAKGEAFWFQIRRRN